uniref:Uncharacterized protein n=1 Tax=Equus asinus asinus TaxID=83772 RepID=A0A8C4MXV0_EQUAS
LDFLQIVENPKKNKRMRKKLMLFLWKRGSPLPKGQNRGHPLQEATANLLTAPWSLSDATCPPTSTITQLPPPLGRTILPPRGLSWTVAGS